MVLRFRVPDRCPFCGTAGMITPEHTLRGKNLTLNWCCQTCNKEWPIDPGEQEPERRKGPSERRKTTRGERRQR